MNDKTEELLRKDSIAETEKVFGGKHYSQFNDFENAVMLMTVVEDNKRKEEHLKSIGDTHFSMKWNEFKELIKVHGFREGLTYDFQHQFSKNDPIYTDEAVLYYHPEKGLVIWATSFFNKKDVNGGTLYGQVKVIENNWKDISMSLNGCSHGAFAYYDKENDVEKYYSSIDFSKDVREGLFHTLNKIESVTEFTPIWEEKKPFLWFLDFTEDDVPGYDYKAITRDKIKRSCKEVQDIIGEY